MTMVFHCNEPGVGVNKLLELLCAHQTAKAHTAAALTTAAGSRRVIFDLMVNSCVLLYKTAPQEVM
jgi:hypothetical protein